MTINEWLEQNREYIERRYAELRVEHPNATIVKPGIHTAINGKSYFCETFVIGE